MRRRFWIWMIGILISLSALWFVAAFVSGTFIPDDARYAVAPGEFTNDALGKTKKLVDLGGYKVAYVDVGKGEPVILLHGCPFSAYEWHEVAPLLAKHFRVIIPDLIGLGDTPVRLNDDYNLLRDVKMVTDLMDHLGVGTARFVGHDHGGAVVQLLMRYAPNRISMAVITNAEAYDQWPSKPETADLHLITDTFTSPLVFIAIHSRWVQRDLYSIAVVNQQTLSNEMLDAFANEHIATALRWQRLRRFFKGQLDQENEHLTLEAVPAMRRFTRPVLMLWGQKDTNFGPDIATRLARDIPGTKGIAWMHNSAHLPMLEEPQAYADAADRFFATGTASRDAAANLDKIRRGIQ